MVYIKNLKVMKFSIPQYSCSNSLDDFQQILALQKKNLSANISVEEVQSQGFVTVVHTQELLESMNELGCHALAKTEDRVVGYALFMSRALEDTIPILEPMFEQFKKVPFQNATLYDCNYFVMGQVCVDKEFRGQGVFQGMYNFLKEKNNAEFDFMVTEVATRNKRSMRAHEKIGFKLINIYKDEIDEWAILIWDFRE